MRLRPLLGAPALLALASPSLAADSLTLGELRLDRPTLHSIGVELLV